MFRRWAPARTKLTPKGLRCEPPVRIADPSRRSPNACRQMWNRRERFDEERCHGALNEAPWFATLAVARKHGEHDWSSDQMNKRSGYAANPLVEIEA